MWTNGTLQESREGSLIFTSAIGLHTNTSLYVPILIGVQVLHNEGHYDHHILVQVQYILGSRFHLAVTTHNSFTLCDWIPDDGNKCRSTIEQRGVAMQSQNRPTLNVVHIILNPTNPPKFPDCVLWVCSLVVM